MYVKKFSKVGSKKLDFFFFFFLIQFGCDNTSHYLRIYQYFSFVSTLKFNIIFFFMFKRFNLITNY